MSKLIQPLSEAFLYRSPEASSKTYCRLLVALHPHARALTRDRQREERRHAEKQR